MDTCTEDNLLYFVSMHFDKLDRQNLNSLLVNFYTLDEFLASKNTLVAECEKISVKDAISEFKKKRLNTRSEADTKQKVSKDILDIWTVTDIQKGGNLLTTFVPTNPPRLPLDAPASLSSLAQSAPDTPAHSSPLVSEECDVKLIVSLLESLRNDIAEQQETIKWLTNVAKNTYQRLKRLSASNQSDISTFDDSILDSSANLVESPRFLPRVPKRGPQGREKLRGKRKCLDPLSASFIPKKQNRTESTPIIIHSSEADLVAPSSPQFPPSGFSIAA